MSSSASLQVSSELQEKYDSYYDETVTEWRHVSAKYKVQHIAEICNGIIEPEKVMEVGAGEGANLALLDKMGFGDKLYGIEISESGADAIRKRHISSLVEAKTFDGYHLPYEDQTIDLIYSTHVLEHVEHERLFLKELMRVGKMILIEVPLEDSARQPNHFVENDIGHINFYHYGSIRRLLQSTGLEIVNEKVYDHPLEIMTFRSGISGYLKFAVRRTLFTLWPRLARRLFDQHYCCLCRPASSSNSTNTVPSQS